MGIQSVTYSPALRIGAGTGDGSSAANAGSSALSIKQRTGTTTNGLYWVKPNPAGSAFQVYCDMNTDGGGWMLFARTNPSVPSITAGQWGWRGTGMGSVSGFTEPYQLPWMSAFHPFGYGFSEFIFGNRLNINNSEWGPFIYKVALQMGYDGFINSTSQDYSTNYTTVKYDLSIYNTTLYPNMQASIGFTLNSQNDNNYYLRDCCGYTTAYGMTAAGMTTTYINASGDAWANSGPWYFSATDGSGNFQQTDGVIRPGVGATYGGTTQAMMMVR